MAKLHQADIPLFNSQRGIPTLIVFISDNTFRVPLLSIIVSDSYPLELRYLHLFLTVQDRVIMITYTAYSRGLIEFAAKLRP